MPMQPVPPDDPAAALIDRALHEIAHHVAQALSEFEAAAEARVTEVEARHTASRARDSRICTALQERLFELEGALRAAEERRASEAGAFADQVAKRHAAFTASLAQTRESRDALAAQLTAVTAALDEAQQTRRADAAAAADRLRRRETELAEALAEAGAARATLERALAEMQAAQSEGRARAEADLAAAQERQAALEDLLAQEADRRASLEQRYSAVEAALEDSVQRHTTELTQAAARLAEAQARYETVQEEQGAAHAAFERQLTDLTAALERTERERLTDAVAFSGQIAARDADLAAFADLQERYDAAVTEHAIRRAALEQQLTEATAEGREQKAALEAQLASARAEAAEGRDDNASLRELLDMMQDQLRTLRRTADGERQAHERARLAAASELERVSGEYGQLRQSFDRLQTAFQTLEAIAGEHADERARLERVVAARDSELNAQAERHRTAAQTAQNAFAQQEESFRQALAARNADVARLEREREALRGELHESRIRVERLRGDAERLPDVQAQLELSQKERRREFERAPYGLCRCTPDGTITDANHSFVAMFGRRRVDEVRNLDFAKVVSDRAGDLGWILERTRTMRRSEAVETSWKTRDGRDLIVRLQALATTTGSVEIVVEDLTSVRALEERLRQAQRIEAVGRLAAEVAVTCDALLGDVARGAHEWMAAGGQAGARHGERLLNDVTRASSFLRQLRVYADQQVRALAPVSVQRVLGDLAPVLKRVVGDGITLDVAKSSGSFDVDVEIERLERVLVNVAGYARARMPRGGQMRIDLETTALGRRFVTRYPNVRPGHHVLITVTELPRESEPRDPMDADAGSFDRPAVELGSLVDLVGSCGGHLWLEAQPAGNLVVKIYLPRRAALDGGEPGEPPGPTDQRGRLARWFRTAPVRA